MTVNWNTETSGFQGLVQKVGATLLTSSGSDKLIPSRGNDALKEITSYGAFDLMNVQHSLNFAASKTSRDIAAFSGGAPPAEQLDSLRLRLADIVDGSVVTTMVVTNAAGETTKTKADIL